MKKLMMAMLCLMGVSAPAFGDITVDGTIIEDQTFTGQVNIKANNCILRRCTFIVGDGLTGVGMESMLGIMTRIQASHLQAI